MKLSRKITFSSFTAVDCLQSPRILRLQIKASKTDSFRVGVNILMGRTRNGLCPITVGLHHRGPGPFLFWEWNPPLFSWSLFRKWRKPSPLTRGDNAAHSGLKYSFRSKAAITASKQESMMPLSRCWAGGRALPIKFASKHLESN